MEFGIDTRLLLGLLALNLMGVLAVLAGVFLGGMLVYKTRFAGNDFVSKDAAAGFWRRCFCRR